MIRKIILTKAEDNSIIAYIDYGHGQEETQILKTIDHLAELLKSLGWK